MMMCDTIHLDDDATHSRKRRKPQYDKQKT